MGTYQPTLTAAVHNNTTPHKNNTPTNIKLRKDHSTVANLGPYYLFQKQVGCSVKPALNVDKIQVICG